jgi:hypothetical protein
VRRTFGVGANLGWRGAYHRHVAFHRTFIRRPVLAAAAVGAAPSWGGWGWNRPLYSAAPGWGGGWGGWGRNRPLYSCSGPFCGSGWGWGGGWGGWGWR